MNLRPQGLRSATLLRLALFALLTGLVLAAGYLHLSYALAPLESATADTLVPALAQFRRQILWATLAAATAITLIAAWSFRRLLHPARQLQRVAEQMSSRGMGERIDTTGLGPEFAGLADVYNTMLERLERTFNQASQFSAGAAHELKTPLSVLQGELERGVQESPPGSDEQARYSRLVEQVQRLKTITHKLLLLATVDASGLRLRKSPFDLSECVQDACDDAAVIAPDITQELHIPPGIMVSADPELMPNVVTNLVINAVVHNHTDGRIGVRIKTTSTMVRVTIKNTGPGISSEEHPRLFTRFYRVDKSRNRAHGGSGLGLSLARDIARAHGGDVFLVDSKGKYTTFELVLPK
jgi:two-component system heavy metal sensor histidine kinase CusS